MTDNTDTPERAPDGLTKLDIRRLRTKYKKMKADMIEADIETLADPSAKSTEVLNRIKAREYLESVLGIAASKPMPEDGESREDVTNTFDTLKASLKATEDAPDES